MIEIQGREVEFSNNLSHWGIRIGTRAIPRMMAKSIVSTNDLARANASKVRESLLRRSPDETIIGMRDRTRVLFTVAFPKHDNEIAQPGDRGASGRVPAYVRRI